MSSLFSERKKQVGRVVRRTCRWRIFGGNHFGKTLKHLLQHPTSNPPSPPSFHHRVRHHLSNPPSGQHPVCHPSPHPFIRLVILSAITHNFRLSNRSSPLASFITSPHHSRRPLEHPSPYSSSHWLSSLASISHSNILSIIRLHRPIRTIFHPIPPSYPSSPLPSQIVSIIKVLVLTSSAPVERTEEGRKGEWRGWGRCGKVDREGGGAGRKIQ